MRCFIDIRDRRKKAEFFDGAIVCWKHDFVGEDKFEAKFGIILDDYKTNYFKGGWLEVEIVEAMEMAYNYVTNSTSNRLLSDDTDDADDADEGGEESEAQSKGGSSNSSSDVQAENDRLKQQIAKLNEKLKSCKQAALAASARERPPRSDSSSGLSSAVKEKLDAIIAELKRENGELNREKADMAKRFERLSSSQADIDKNLREATDAARAQGRADAARQAAATAKALNGALPSGGPGSASVTPSASPFIPSAEICEVKLEHLHKAFKAHVDALHNTQDSKKPLSKVVSIQIDAPDTNEKDNFVLVTMDHFAKNSSFEKLNSLIEVKFISAERSDGRGLRQTLRYVAADAIDAGGLSENWLSTFLQQVQYYFFPAKVTDDLSSFYKFDLNNGTILAAAFTDSHAKLPSIVLLKSSSTPADLSQPLLDSNGAVSKAADKQREVLNKLYSTVGIVLNQRLREGQSLPERFASPFLIYYLLGGERGILQSSLTATEIAHAAQDFGFNEEAINYMIASEAEENPTREQVWDALWKGIMLPRASSLAAMKRGFDIVHISQPLLSFPWLSFKKIFVGSESFTADDVLDLIKQGWDDPPAHLKSIPLSDRFKSVVSEAFELGPDEDIEGVRGFDFPELKQFLEFVTSKSWIDSQKIHVWHTSETTMRSEWAVAKCSDSNPRRRYPSGTLLRSHTCFNSLDLIYIKDDDRGNLWNPKNVILNIRHSLANGAAKSGFEE